jgi:hypothetical protein
MDIAGAEKKLRQAEFFLSWLKHASKEMSIQYANPAHASNPEHLEFYFSACLSAAQSVYYVLEETGGSKFKDANRELAGGS